MPAKKEAPAKRYNMRQDFKCEECGTVSKITGPCEKCKNETFVSFFTVQEIK